MSFPAKRSRGRVSPERVLIVLQDTAIRTLHNNKQNPAMKALTRKAVQRPLAMGIPSGCSDREHNALKPTGAR